MNRVKFAAALTACAAVAGMGASAASAKTRTLHFFSKGAYSRVSDATGKPITSQGPLAPGDRVSFASNDYVGNHAHHARRAKASDHVDCTITQSGNGLCDGEIAIGGSMILGDDFGIDFTSNMPTPTVVTITGGTGRYRHARGTITATPVGNNTDLVIRVTT